MDVSRRQRWEKKWSRPDYQPGWRIRFIPIEVREAVESGWFPTGEPVLDIGCGSGEIAAWLGAQGYDVTGIDFAPAAIARAKAAHPEARGLRFDEVDICRQAPGEARYGALLDRGCLHGFDAESKPDYARNVAAAAKPGARFLLLHVIHEDTIREEVVQTLESLCRPAFDVVRVSDTVLSSGSAGSEPPRRRLGAEARRRGVALWMIRSS